MIALLRGRIAEISTDGVILDVGGVGYLLLMGVRDIEQLGDPDAEVTVLVETVVREDSIRLYGFLTGAEKTWFRLLQDVQGVGAKVALAVLGTLSPEELAAAIASSDHMHVARTPGVGPKLAKRIISELKDKVPADIGAVGAKRALASPVPLAPGALARADATSALVNLGYAQPQAAKAIDRAISHQGEEADVSALIREGLKLLSEG